jgi:hypothetical protein
MIFRAKFNSLLFYTLTIIILLQISWLAKNFQFTFDLSSSKQNTLSTETIHQLQRLSEAIHIISFSTQNQALREKTQRLIEKFQRHKNNLTFEFINPDLSPQRVQQNKIEINGQLLIEYSGKQTKVTELSERAIIKALISTSNEKQYWLGYITGHDERYAYAENKDGLSIFNKKAKQLAIRSISLNLTKIAKVPDNISVIVIASPKKPYLKLEIEKLITYLKQGGNLLLMLEPGINNNLDMLLEYISITKLSGTVIDLETQRYKEVPPSFVLIKAYPEAAVLSSKLISLFPQASAFKISSAWQPILITKENSWTETGKIEDEIKFNEEIETAGPLTIGAITTNLIGDKKQHIAVIGDGDFLSNRYIGQGGNMEVSLKLLKWLVTQDDSSLPTETIKANQHLELSRQDSIAMVVILFLTLPGIFISAGLFIWLRRRKL